MMAACERNGIAHTTTAPGDDQAPTYSYQDIYEKHALLVRQRNSIIELIHMCRGNPALLLNLQKIMLEPLYKEIKPDADLAPDSIVRELSKDIRRLGAWLVVEGLGAARD